MKKTKVLSLFLAALLIISLLPISTAAIDEADGYQLLYQGFASNGTVVTWSDSAKTLTVDYIDEGDYFQLDNLNETQYSTLYEQDANGDYRMISGVTCRIVGTVSPRAGDNDYGGVVLQFFTGNSPFAYKAGGKYAVLFDISANGYTHTSVSDAAYPFTSTTGVAATPQISGRTRQYTITTTTESDGTDDDVYITLYGSDGTATEELQLDVIGINDFEAGETNTFPVSAKDVGNVAYADVRYSSYGDTWSCIGITIDGASYSASSSSFSDGTVIRFYSGASQTPAAPKAPESSVSGPAAGSTPARVTPATGSSAHPQANTTFGSRSSQWAVAELNDAFDKNLVPQVLVGQDLTTSVTRAEFAAVAVQLYETLTGKVAASGVNPFNDLAGNENTSAILRAFTLNITNGTTAATFEPSADITREQLATMLTRVIKKYSKPDWSLANDASYYLDTAGVTLFADDGDISDYAKSSVYFLAKFGIVKGVDDTHFAPKNTTTQQAADGYATATREQAVLIALRIFKLDDLW